MSSGDDLTAARLCPECGASIPGRTACIDLFHALLAGEPELLAHISPAERKSVAHFYAVASYVLQHPHSMGYTAEALADARRLLARHLCGQGTLSDARAEVRRAVNGDRRVLRQPGDPPLGPAAREWPITIDHVLQGDDAEYWDRVARWAQSVISTLGAV